MAESRPYRLPNTQGRYVTVTVTNQRGEVYRVNDDGTRTIYADYFVENGNVVLEATQDPFDPNSSDFSSPEFRKNLAQNYQAYNRTISDSILQANGQTNSQPDPNQPGAPGGSTPTNPNTPEENENSQNGGVGLIYPEDLASTDQDRIKFQALTYSSNPQDRLPDAVRSFEFSRPKFTAVSEGPVFLPIQSSITDQNSVTWEPDTINPIELKAVQFSMDVMTSNTTEQLATAVENHFKNAMVRLKESSQQVRTYLAGQAVGVNNLLSRLNGQVLNPNLELLFQGPQLRPFSFTFKLSPRSANEAKTVKKIINYFKKNMAPIVGDAGLFLSAPNVFKIEYQHKNAEHTGINLIKECALTNCSVDYTPLGTYMTYPDGTMVSYTMTLQFQELEPVYSDDYNDDQSIGF